MVHTQAQHIFLALTALAVVAGPLGGTAAALPGEERDIDLAVNGSVQSRTEQELAAPADVPAPARGVGQEVEFRYRTQDLVLPNPAGHADEAVPMAPWRIDEDGITVGRGRASLLVPWYYMMDDGSVRPYYALFWDTGSAWYLAVADDAWSTYAPASSPTPVLGRVAPQVWLRTGVEEIDLAASVRVLLNSALAAATQGSFERPDAPTLAGDAARSLRAEEGLGLAPLALAALPADHDAAAAQAAPEPLRSALAAGPQGVLNIAPLQAAAGVAGFAAVLALYHLIRKSAILKNKVRSSIAEHVLRQPGSTITEIAQAVGVTHQTASYHLRLLQEHGLVLGVERGNKRLYFRNDGSFNNEERGLVAVLRDPESMRVLELIRTNPWIMKNEAAAALGVSRNTLNWHLQKLLSAGLVSEARENGHCFLFCNRRAAGEVLTQVVAKVEERKGIVAAAPAVQQGPSAMLMPSPLGEREGLGGGA